jgi:hypothetical protein
VNAKEFAKLVARDTYCLHCGEQEAISPNHRSNLVVLCSELNNLIESDSWHRGQALKYGWKLASWDSPEVMPVFDGVAGVWYLLDNNYGRIVAER